MKKTIVALTSVLTFLLLLGCSFAQEVTLRLHHFLAPTSNVHVGYLEPWAERVEAASDGRIEVQIYHSMQLGGAPPSLFDQAKDGVVDIVWTLPGYTAGRFPKSEVFELPFMSGLAEHSSQALCEFHDLHLREEFGDVRVLTLHTAGPGLFHVRGDPITGLGDLRGMQVRGPSRITIEALALLGAEPIGMPVPQVPESLSRGVVDAALLPWEVTESLRIAELVDSHTTFDSKHGFYTSVFLLAMNQRSYERLPDDLKTAIDENSMASGCEEARIAGANMDAGDIPGQAAAAAQGNPVHVIPAGEVNAWQEAIQPAIEAWIARMDRAGYDGAAMLDDARELIARFEAAD